MTCPTAWPQKVLNYVRSTVPSLKLAPSNVSKTTGFILLPPTARSRNIVYIKYTSDNRKFNIIFLQNVTQVWCA